MSLRETAGSLEQYILEYSDDITPIRTPELVELEEKLHRGLRPWAKNHESRYAHIGVLPIMPSVFSDQRIEQSGREVTRLSKLLPEKTYMRLHKKAYIKAVGSAALANQIIDGFKTTPAFEDEPELSIVDYTVQHLDENESIAIASGHLDRLSDITDFTDGLNLAVAEEYGLKYADRFKVIINKLMSMEKIFNIPMAWLLSVGLAPRWGLPEIGADKWGIPKEVQEAVNKILAQTLVQEQRRKGQVVGIVPAGSAAILQRNQDTDVLEKIQIPHSSATASLFPRYSGVIPANRWGDDLIIGSVIPVNRPKDMHIREYSNSLIDQINYTLAIQASELAGVQVEFERLKVGRGAGIVAVRAFSEQGTQEF